MQFCDEFDKGTASVHQILCKSQAFLFSFITGDDSWSYGYDPVTKQ
jgi:hypothetical protein